MSIRAVQVMNLLGGLVGSLVGSKRPADAADRAGVPAAGCGLPAHRVEKLRIHSAEVLQRVPVAPYRTPLADAVAAERVTVGTANAVGYIAQAARRRNTPQCCVKLVS